MSILIPILTLILILTKVAGVLFIFLWLIVSQLATKLSYRRRLDKVKTVMIMMTKVSQFATKLSSRLKDDQDTKHYTSSLALQVHMPQAYHTINTIASSNYPTQATITPFCVNQICQKPPKMLPTKTSLPDATSMFTQIC